MLVSLIRKFFTDRRGATAVALAIMLVPMLIAAGAAVDLARIATVRSLLQASVDSSITAGLNEWTLSESSTDAYNVANNAFNNTGAQLFPLGTGVSATVQLSCMASAAQCGQSQAYGNTALLGCASTFEYCMSISARLTLKNSLAAIFLPSELLTVYGAGYSTGGSTNVQGQPVPPNQGFHSAGDYNLGTAYAVPMTLGTSGTPEYDTLPTPNTYCQTSPGPVIDVPYATPASGVTQCNYLFIADSLGSNSTGGSISLGANQPIAFLFSNFTGENGYHQTDGTHYTTNLMISTDPNGGDYKYYPNGETVTLTACTYTAINCNPAAVGSSVALYGQCPDHTLYGSMDFNDGTPESDSTNPYSSAYEVIGLPPTFFTNHVMTPFVTTKVITQTLNGTTYYVKSVCPNYDTSGTQISAPVSATYAAQANNDDAFSGANTFSSWFPKGKIQVSDAGIVSAVNPRFSAFQDDANSVVIDGGTIGGTTNIFPTAIGGCTPALNATDGGVTPVSKDSWWSWSPSNYGNCTNHQTTNYSNCSLLIQPLGTHVPVDSNNEALIPDYYNIIETPSGAVLALDPVYDNTVYQDRLTGVTITNTDPAGYYPTNTTPQAQIIANATTIHGDSVATPYANSAFVNDLLVVQEPAQADNGNIDHDMPLMTSHRCYDPSVAIDDAGYKPSGATSDYLGYYSYTNNGTTLGLALDPIANPQLGAVICNTDPPQTYALYWNDLGTYESDDLGYWNALYTFTCSVPDTSNSSTGAPIIAF